MYANIDPESEEQNVYAAQDFIKKGKELTNEGKIEEAIIACEKVQQLGSALEISAECWNSLGWNGSLLGYAADVMHACEQAVKLDPGNAGYRDTRGLARALTGDYAGAIKDFEFFIKWGQGKASDEVLQKRQNWILSIP